MMPNGTSRGAPPITFGAINEPGPGPALSGSAAAASNPSLTAPVASNQRASSPQSSPSPVVQPMATGGASGQATAASGRIQFGDTTHHVSRNAESYVNFRTYLTWYLAASEAYVHASSAGRARVYAKSSET